MWWVDLFGAGHDAGWGADGDPFHAANPRVIVKLNYAGSADLAAQILQGARVDIVATANTSTMNTVTAAGLVDGPPTVFATNQLQIVVGTGNPKGITSGPSPVSIAAMCFYDHRITGDLRASLSPRSDPQELMCGVDCWPAAGRWPARPHPGRRNVLTTRYTFGSGRAGGVSDS